LEVFNKDVKVHFVGIGGIGMSGIAQVLLQLGFEVSGSDMAESQNTSKLKKLGAEIHIGHSEENVRGSTVLVYSSAINTENPEMVFAKREQLPIMKRAEMLAELMKLKKGIAIAGTHGKTTTTSMLATILHENSFDPTYIIGGIVKNLDDHANVGQGDFLVAEADESDGSFLLLNPVLSVITNIDNDHMEHYGNEANLEEAFLKFANKVPFYGVCVLNIADKKIQRLTKLMRRPFRGFAVEREDVEGADYFAKNLKTDETGVSFDLAHEGKTIKDFKIITPGHHNVENALGAITIAHGLGLSFEKIKEGLSKFEGVGRRLQTLKKEDGIEIIDDYGHHPTEIATTIDAVKSSRKGKKLVVVFEPHRYTRTRDCWDQFLHCFNEADKVFIAPIYGASEAPLPGIISERLVIDLNKLHPGLAFDLADYDQLKEEIKSEEDETVFLSLGAGAIGKKIREIVDEM
jgi:UDP-N-acetylmuramate--alanine ligase